MKFGNLIRAALAASAMAAMAAQAAPLYFFGNAPTAGAVFPTDPASADYAPVTKRNEFLTAVETTGNESFEASAPGFISSTANQLTVFGTGTLLSQAQPTGQPYLGATVMNGTSSNGRFNTTGGAASGRWIQTDSNFTITLGAAVGAFGFYGTDFGDFAGGLQIALYDAAGDLIDDNVFTDSGNAPLQPRLANTQDSQDGSLLFFGYASERLFSRIVFSINQSSTPNDDPNLPPIPMRDILGFDDMVLGNLRTTTPPTGVPEPGSLALAGLALFAAGWARKTQRRA